MLKVLIAVVCLLIPLSVVQAAEVRVSCAASLKDAVSELSDRYARQHAGVSFVRNFGGSGALAKQIENGAPADIFISANREWLDYLLDRRLIEPAGVATFAFNTLVFAGRGDKRVAGMGDLARLERIAIGSPKSVPAGGYAMEALKKAGVAPSLAGKLVMARDVREALMYAERGEVDGAFVYLTDARQAKQVRILFTVPQVLYPRITYPAGLTASGARNRDAVAFFRYLQSAEARTVLERYGFAVR